MVIKTIGNSILSSICVVSIIIITFILLVIYIVNRIVNAGRSLVSNISNNSTPVINKYPDNIQYKIIDDDDEQYNIYQIQKPYA